MPSAIEYIPPTDSRRNALNLELISERQARRARYVKALKYYNGEHPEQLEYDEEIEPNDNTVINLVQITADRTASFLFPAIPKFQTDPNSVEETEEEKWIRQVIEENGGLEFLIRLVLRGFLSGHSFVRVKPGERRGNRIGNPKFVLLDPLAITIYWKADDVGEVLWYENRYLVGTDVYIQDYVWRPEKGEAGEWEIYTYKARGDKINYIEAAGYSPHGAGNKPRSDYIDYVDSSSFEIVKTEEGTDFARHPSPIPPIIEFPHLPHPDDRYSHGEVTQTDLQDTINRVWSEINRIVRKHSDPRDVIVGADIDTVEVGDDITTVPNAEAKVQRLELKGDLKAAVETVEKLIETYLAVARTVLLKGEAKDLQRVTNASVRTLFVDALAKNEVLRSTYGRGLINMVKLAMMMAAELGKGFAFKALDAEIGIQWSEPLPVDKMEIANINAVGVSGGWRSKRTAATAMGDNWAFEERAIAAESEMVLERAVKQAEMLAKITPPEQPEQNETGQDEAKPDGA